MSIVEGIVVLRVWLVSIVVCRSPPARTSDFTAEPRCVESKIMFKCCIFPVCLVMSLSISKGLFIILVHHQQLYNV